MSRLCLYCCTYFQESTAVRMSVGPGQEGESEGSIDRAKPQGLAWEVPSSEEGAKREYVGALLLLELRAQGEAK